METMERINQLAAERARLFRDAGKGGRGDTNVMAKAGFIDAELERLWAQRRAERAGRAEGIDRLIEAQYERVYGPDETPLVSQEELSGLAA